MKLTKEDILNIDAYLKEKGIKYTDVRFELIDHLVTEYESLENYPDLDSFLRKRLIWCRNISEKKAKAVHWGYQKDLWKRVLTLIKSPLFYLISFVLGLVVNILYVKVSETIFQNIITCSFFGFVVLQVLDSMYLFFKQRRKIKLVSSQYLFNIYSLPHLFLYLFTPFADFLKQYNYILIGYLAIALLLNVAAFIEVKHKQKQIKTQYNFLKLYFA